MENTSNSIVFAYYSENKFLGWYGGTFGPVATVPKVYNKSERQYNVIAKNFQHKLKSVNETSFDEAKDKTTHILDSIALLRFDSEDILRNKNVELRVVECPYYDGPNEFHSNTITDKFRRHYTELYHEWCDELGLEAGIEKGTNLGIGLIENFKQFRKTYPTKTSENWIYVDYKKVTEWSKNEPTEFLETLSEYKITN
jgi:hypothetical protein